MPQLLAIAENYVTAIKRSVLASLKTKVLQRHGVCAPATPHRRSHIVTKSLHLNDKRLVEATTNDGGIG